MSKPELHAIVWDMDGVLAYTNEFHYQAWKEIYRRFSGDITPLPRSTFDSLFGMRNDATVKQMFGSEQATARFITQISEEKELLFRSYIRGHLEPLPGVKAWLAEFQTRGFRQAVASSAPEDNIKVILDEINGWPFFEVVLSGDASDLLASKPAPDIFLEASRQLNVAPARCLVIEDSVVGVQAAKAAGMLCLAITTTHCAQELEMADRIIDDFSATSPQMVLDMFASREVVEKKGRDK